MKKTLLLVSASVALSWLCLSPGVALAQFTCTCISRGAGSTAADGSPCPDQSAIKSNSPIPDVTDCAAATKKCDEACTAVLGEACDAGANVTCPAPGTTCPPGSTCLTNPINVSTVPELAANIISTAVGIVGALALLMFIYGGLRWLTSAGEPVKIQAGKDAMKWAAIGLVVIFSSYALVSFVFKALTG